MLVRITNDFYIDMEQIYMVDKEGRDIRIFVKVPTPDNEPFVVQSTTKEGKEFLFQLNKYLGISE